MKHYESSNTVVLTQAEMRALVTCSSKDTTRSHLNAVLIAGGVAVSTDGHRLLLLTCGPKGAQYLVPREAMKEASRFKFAIVTNGKIYGYNTKTEPSPECDGSGANGMVPFTPVDAPFPPYEQVVPKPRGAEDKSVAAIGFDANLYGETLQVCGKIVRGRVPAVKITTYENDLDPVRIDAELDHGDGATMTAVIMPCRI